MTKDKKKAILKYLYNEKHRTLVNGISIHNVIKDWKIVDIKHTLCSLEENKLISANKECYRKKIC